MNFLFIYRCTLCFLFLSVSITCAGDISPANNVPHELAGFKLDSLIDDYDHIPMRHSFLQEVVVRDVNGFRKGNIFYGVCAEPGEIIKMQFKLKNRSLQIFNRLLKIYTDKYGAPHNFAGDAFGEVIAWKWSFNDQEGNKITLILQHNKGDSKETVGNEIKLKMPERLQQERACFNKKFTADMQNKHKQSGNTGEMSDAELMQFMIPR
jgi:hypothetical protein